VGGGQEKVENFFHDPSVTEKMAIVWGGEVRMANLCVAGGLSVNGVSGLHSEILKKDVFKNSYAMEPWKFTNVTNGIDHRRWLSEINPGLDGLVRDLAGGDDYLLHPQALKKLDAYADDAAVLKRLDEIKWQNKVKFADYARKAQGVTLDPNAIFDVQVKRLHEYKRQLLNVLHIITLYQQLQDDPNCITRPHTFLFGAKAAPGYAVAKRIIHLINSLADDISHDPRCRGKLQVVFPDGMTEVPSDLPVLHASQIGRIHTFIMRMSAQEAEDRLAAYSPLLVDAVPLTLEEIFIYELGGADYAVKDIVL